MSQAFSILMALAMLATLAVLGMGLFSMIKGGEFNKKHANTLMRWRVGLQAAALILFALALLSHKSVPVG